MGYNEQSVNVKDTITFEDFTKLDLRVGEVLKVEKKEGSDKLLRLTVDFGEIGQRIILSGIAPWYTPSQVKGKKFIFVVNLAPRKMMGEESQGMIICAVEGEAAKLIPVPKTVNTGSTVR